MAVLLLASLGSGTASAWADSTVDQSFEAPASGGALAVFREQYVAQMFTAGRTGALDRVQLLLYRNAEAMTEPVHIEIVPVDDAGLPAAGEPLASADVAASDVSLTPRTWVDVRLDEPAVVTQGVQYALTATSTSSRWYLWEKNTGTYPGGTGARQWPNEPWFMLDTVDLGFRTYVDSADTDGDGVFDAMDNCPSDGNADQVDADGDGVGDVCDADDNDGPAGDLDLDGTMNADDPDDNDGPAGDLDGDGVTNGTDNCPSDGNADQVDADGDGVGDVCDATPNGPVDADSDSDGVTDADDNCLAVANPAQADTDGDDVGDWCEATHARSMTLDVSHVTVTGTTRLELSGDIEVADTATRCVTNRRVILERYDGARSRWLRVQVDRTDQRGHYEYVAPHAVGNYRARVPRQSVTYDGFTSSCSAASMTLRHRH